MVGQAGWNGVRQRPDGFSPGCFIGEDRELSGKQIVRL